MSNYRVCSVMVNGHKCGNPATISIPAARRGNRPACVCAECAARMESYFSENNLNKGISTRDKTYSAEYESSRSTVKARYELSQNGFVPSADCTCDIEYKSPIWHNLKSPVRVTKTVQRLIESGDLEINASCGTHFHCGLPNNGFSADMPCGVSRRAATINMYHSLFLPLSRWLETHPAETVALFGRNFGDWARPIYPHIDTQEHTNFINLQHSYSIEFRLCFFKSAAQYALCMKTCDKIWDALEAHFWSKYTAERTEAGRAARKAAADKAAKYIVRIVEKASAEAMNIQ